MDRNHCEISEVIFKDANVPPVIGCFQNGILKPSVGNIRKCGIFRNHNESDKYIVAVHTNDNALYMGSEPRDELYRTLLAVQDKRSNKIQLIEVDKVSLKPKSIVSDSVLINPITNSNLNKTFGSRISKRKTEQRERMTVNVEALSSQLQNTATNVNVDNVLDLVDEREYQGTYVTCNRNAKVVNDVYKLNDIISCNELQELQNEASAMLSNSDEDNVNNYSPFLIANLKKLPADNRLYYAQILLYAECLVQFLSECKKTKKIEAQSIFCPFSEAINTKILDNFTVKSKKHREVQLTGRDKALCHAVIAGLLACDFKLHIEPLCKLIQTSQEKLQRLCRMLGAVSSRAEKNTIVLKIPLPPLRKPRIIKRKNR